MARAVPITTGLPYADVYARINAICDAEAPVDRRSSARTGVGKKATRRLMEDLGWRLVTLMSVGKGCEVHLAAEELPKGRLVMSVSKHVTAMIDGVVRDTFDPRRYRREASAAGMRLVPTRCIYGYFIDPTEEGGV